MAVIFDPFSLTLLAAAFLGYWGLAKSETARLVWLVALSLVCLAKLHPLLALSAFGAASLVHFTYAQTRPRQSRLKLACGVAVVLSCWAIWKLAIVERTAWLAPLGASFFAMRAIQIVADSHRGSLGETSWARTLHFFCFFPTFLAGPIDPYRSVFNRRERGLSWELLEAATRRLLIGYFKKIVIVDFAFELFFGDLLSRFPLEAGTDSVWWVSQALPFAVVSFARAYFDLSAYTDIAVGLSLLFGFRVAENFRLPFAATSLPDFWRRWHVSVSSWCRDQVFFPVLGATRRPAAALYASMGAMAVWHSLSWNWLLWGGYHATGMLVASQWARLRLRVPLLHAIHEHPLAIGIARLLTLLFVALGYALTGTQGAQAALGALCAAVTQSRCGTP